VGLPDCKPLGILTSILLQWRGKPGDRTERSLKNQRMDKLPSLHAPWASPHLPFVKRWLSLILVSNDSELHAEGVQNRIDSFEAWVCACTQDLV